MSDRELTQRLSECAPTFQMRMTNLAHDAGCPTLTVYRMWREYARQCSDFDQSPSLGEFDMWYADKLTP